MDEDLINGVERRRVPGAVRVALLAAGGLLVGLPAGWGVGRLVKTGHLTPLAWSDVLALALAAALLALGLLTAGLSASHRGRAVLANHKAPDYGRPQQPEQIRFFRLQAGVLVLAGAMLAAPVLFDIAAPGILHGVSKAAGWAVMVAVAAAFALQTALNLAVWRASDEVVRRVIAESGAASFWLLQGAFFLWASGEKLGVLPVISSWDAVTVLMGAYLVTSTIVSVRSGLG